MNTIRKNDLRFGLSAPGPVLIFENGPACSLIGYEHGATYPDSYLEYKLKLDEKGGLTTALCARKGNTFDGQPVGGGAVFSSVWFHFLAAEGGQDKLASAYRCFFQSFITQNQESRKPYIFYNTWNYQERDRNLYGKPYLANMRLEKVLSEIEKAHEIGIEVFVIDTGWFEKTGDWLVNLWFFPDGMKLGLWFNPTVAAVTSRIVTGYPKYRMSINGESKSGPVWETGDSYGMCLGSGYWEAFADQLKALYHELGVCYFKWDGIGQDGCDSLLHDHGGAGNTTEERSECYGYLLGLRMPLYPHHYF
jgi:alpha-galactosidase